MNWRQIKAPFMIDFEREHPLSMRDWLTATRELLAAGARPVFSSASRRRTKTASGWRSRRLPLTSMDSSA